MPESPFKISLVIPFRLTGNTFEGESRLARICSIVPRDLFDILVVDYGSAPEYSSRIVQAAGPDVRIVVHPDPLELFSIGRCRDYGVQLASNPVVMFHDVDFLAGPEMYRQIHAGIVKRNLLENVSNFICIPVLFLTEKGTNDHLDKMLVGRPLLEKCTIEAIESADALVQNAAFGSSALVVNKNHYLAAGGHDPSFRGHGFEDFELMHRLSSLAPLAPRPHEYLTDFRTNQVRRYWGFRAFFALYGLPAFREGLYLVHLWHPRRKERGYFRPRENLRALRRSMKSFDRHLSQPDPLTDLSIAPSTLILASGRDEVLMKFRQILPLLGHVQIIAVKPGSNIQDIIRASISKIELTVVLIFPSALQDAVTNVLACAVEVNTVIIKEQPGALILDHHNPTRQTIGWFPVKLPAILKTAVLKTRFGIPIHGYFQELQLQGDKVARLIPQEDLDSFDGELLESFGGSAAFDKKTYPRPRVEKKSSWLTRLLRYFSGY